MTTFLAVFSVVGTLVTIASLWFAIHSRRKKSLTLNIREWRPFAQTGLLQQDPAGNLLKGAVRAPRDLQYFHVELENTGTISLRPEDFVGGAPLSLIFVASVIGAETPTPTWPPDQVQGEVGAIGHMVIVEPLLLNPRERLTVVGLLDGTNPLGLSLELGGRLVGVTGRHLKIRDQTRANIPTTRQAAVHQRMRRLRRRLGIYKYLTAAAILALSVLVTVLLTTDVIVLS